MIGLGYFTCSYSRQADMERASPCGRRATGRRGEPKCLGHWAVSWLLASLGATERARKTWSSYIWVAFVYYIGITVTAAMDGHTPPLEIALFALAVVYVGGLLLAISGENAFGGVVGLAAGLPAGAVSIALGVEELLSSVSLAPHRSGQTSQMLEIFTGFSDMAIGLVVVAGWLNFVLYYREHHQLANIAVFLSSLAFIVLAIAAIVLVVFSPGSGTSLLAWLLIISGVSLVARGLGFIKKLLIRIRV